MHFRLKNVTVGIHCNYCTHYYVKFVMIEIMINYMYKACLDYDFTSKKKKLIYI